MRFLSYRRSPVLKAIFTHKVNSIYDDLPEERYHFPISYLNRVERTVGDFIIYYEPGRTGTGDRNRTGRSSYFATAQVVDVEADPLRSDHRYARIDPTTYLLFERPVPFKEGSHFYERALEREGGQTNKGAFNHAIRILSDAEYNTILRAAFTFELAQERETNQAAVMSRRDGLDEAGAPFERPVVERLMSRPVRDAVFARAVHAAYDRTCAMTGIRILNGGGRAEVEAAHIRPVHDSGPDSLRNGLALSRTVHWPFDRGLVSVGPAPAFELLVSRRAELPDAVRRLLRPDRRLALPLDPRARPAPAYLDYHRQSVFKD